MPTLEEFEAAHDAYMLNEPRDLFYRAATELVDRALQGASSLNVPEALAVLLQTWNKAYYQFKPFTNRHFEDIERVVSEHWQDLKDFRARSIESFSAADEPAIKTIFGDFEEVLGPVGAAKCLHLLARHFFPLWDNAIAEAYGTSVQQGRNRENYNAFMKIAKGQCQALGSQLSAWGNPLKALDEYNYSRYTKGWIHFTGKLYDFEACHFSIGGRKKALPAGRGSVEMLPLRRVSVILPLAGERRHYLFSQQEWNRLRAEGRVTLVPPDKLPSEV